MDNILESFVKVAPYINKLTKSDFAVSVCDLHKCLAYVPSDKQDHKIRFGDSHIKGSVSYESILTGERIVKKVGGEFFGFPYIAIAIPIRDSKEKILGSVTFTEAVDRQDLLLALADNLHETMKQMTSITGVTLENSLKLKDLGEGFKVVAEEIRKFSQLTDDNLKNSDLAIEELKKLTSKINENLEDLLDLSSDQIEINTYIGSLVNGLNERTCKLRESAKALSK